MFKSDWFLVFRAFVCIFGAGQYAGGPYDGAYYWSGSRLKESYITGTYPRVRSTISSANRISLSISQHYPGRCALAQRLISQYRSESARRVTDCHLRRAGRRPSWRRSGTQ